MYLTSLPILLFTALFFLFFLTCAIYGLVVGEIWLAGKFYRRVDNSREFYKTIATYMFLSVSLPLMLGCLLWIRSL